MKLKTKILLTFIFFAVFLTFSNTDSLAVTYNGFELPDLPEDYSNYKYHYIKYNFNSSCFDLCLTNTKLTTSYPNCSTCDKEYSSYDFECTHLINARVYRYMPGIKDYWYFHKNFDVLRFNYNPGNQPYLYSDTDVYQENGTLYFKANSIENYYNYVIDNFLSVKTNLFELNLTDKNFNNTQHKFYIKANSKYSNYTELMNYINNGNNYTIYITDYLRLLTFENNKLDCPISDANYKISGYIDFLISDKAYFYFSPYYNRIKICSGNYISGNITTYTKRFFFTLVSSEDSSNLYFNITNNNGSLWSLNDYVNDGNSSASDTIEDISNSYFIGSNQTIYYAKEDSNHILQNLTNSIYYIGCKGSGKIRGEDTRIYNFGFAGGKTKQFFLSEATFDTDITDTNEEITQKTESEVPIVKDSTSGNSSIIPEDKTSYTYVYDTITDNTSNEDDLNNIEDKREPYISDNSTEDTSNWGILDFIKGIFSKITSFITGFLDIFKGLFVPDTEFLGNTFSGLDEWFTGRLGFLFYPFDLTVNIFNRITEVDFGEPKFEIPDIVEPTTGKILIEAKEFNFNDILQNETFANLYNIYLVIVDGIIVFALINLIKNKFGEVMSK